MAYRDYGLCGGFKDYIGLTDLFPARIPATGPNNANEWVANVFGSPSDYAKITVEHIPGI
ncbi:hypothetical protein K504DRAFT_508111 [Pleomassaria siparia CBS 279.74]|uniref:Uncharacterized protein n=1 Tax=Pleomassaria siparia CBS 279.74 TaxID=1314801 RepID=A0A6G1JSA3_9PLEO|nr:hypothetical protein K504DRAFT_508111 [Pleomassaria siparia CBS 279.74]